MIFIDTWAWVALAIPEDQYHSQQLRFIVNCLADENLW